MEPTRILSAVVAAGPGAREPIRRSLALAGVRVAEFHGDIQGAIAAVRREQPYLCVLDRDLPGATLAAIAALTSPGRRPKLVVVGGSGSRSEARAASLAGATACLPGAVDAARLAQALADLSST